MAESGQPPVRFRPHRARVAAVVAAVVCVLASVAVAAALSGPVAGGRALFGPVDRVATVGLGLVAALALLSLGRPQVTAGAEHLQVRNIVGGAQVPWRQVVAVRFDRRAFCAALELRDGDLVPLHAIQVVDRQRALAAVRALRRLHAAYDGDDARDPQGTGAC